MKCGKYKFLPSKYKTAFLDGQLKFGALHEYRLQEAINDDVLIGDAYDGVSILHVDDSLITEETELGPELKRYLSVAPGSTMHVQNFTYVNAYNCHIFCFAEGDFDELSCCLTMPTSTSDGYDACVEICNVENFCRKIRSAKYKDKTIEEYFEVDVRKVIYSNKNLVDNQDVYPPWMKRTSYENQKETRIILSSLTGESIMSDIFIDIDVGEGLFRETEINPKIVARSKCRLSAKPKDPLEACGRLRQLVREYGPKFKPDWRAFTHSEAESEIQHIGDLEDQLFREFFLECRKAYGEIRSEVLRRIDDSDKKEKCLRAFRKHDNWILSTYRDSVICNKNERWKYYMDVEYINYLFLDLQENLQRIFR